MKMFHPIIQAILDAGIEINVVKDEIGIRFDINTGAKSWAHLYVKDESEMLAFLRYDERRAVSSFDDVCELVVYCMMHKPSINWQWSELLLQKGLLPEERQ